VDNNLLQSIARADTDSGKSKKEHFNSYKSFYNFTKTSNKSKIFNAH